MNQIRLIGISFQIFEEALHDLKSTTIGWGYRDFYELLKFRGMI